MRRLLSFTPQKQRKNPRLTWLTYYIENPYITIQLDKLLLFVCHAPNRTFMKFKIFAFCWCERGVDLTLYNIFHGRVSRWWCFRWHYCKCSVDQRNTFHDDVLWLDIRWGQWDLQVTLGWALHLGEAELISCRTAYRRRKQRRLLSSSDGAAP